MVCDDKSICEKVNLLCEQVDLLCEQVELLCEQVRFVVTISQWSINSLIGNDILKALLVIMGQLRAIDVLNCLSYVCNHSVAIARC